jgi:hypothetical protein
MTGGITMSSGLCTGSSHASTVAEAPANDVSDKVIALAP